MKIELICPARQRNSILWSAVILIAMAGNSAASAQELKTSKDVFHPGPVIKTFGDIAEVKSDLAIPVGMEFKVRFDVSRKARKDTINSTFDSAARFINLHVAAGVPKEKIHVAIVVHGSAAMDLTRANFYGMRNDGQKNGSMKAVEVLQKHQTSFYLCGQTAAFYKIRKPILLPGVKIAHSAMTAHAILGKQGFSLNPF